jgi:hypothetical protein
MVIHGCFPLLLGSSAACTLAIEEGAQRAVVSVSQSS